MSKNNISIIGSVLAGSLLALYNLVTSSNIFYKTALDTSNMQNRLFADLFKEKDLENKWDSENIIYFVKTWMQQNTN